MSAISEFMSTKPLYGFGARAFIKNLNWYEVHAYKSLKARTAAIPAPRENVQLDETPRWTLATAAAALGVPKEFARRELHRLDKRSNVNGDFWTLEEIEAVAATERVQKWNVRAVLAS